MSLKFLNTSSCWLHWNPYRIARCTQFQLRTVFRRCTVPKEACNLARKRNKICKRGQWHLLLDGLPLGLSGKYTQRSRHHHDNPTIRSENLALYTVLKCHIPCNSGPYHTPNTHTKELVPYPRHILLMYYLEHEQFQ